MLVLCIVSLSSQSASILPITITTFNRSHGTSLPFCWTPFNGSNIRYHYWTTFPSIVSLDEQHNTSTKLLNEKFIISRNMTSVVLRTIISGTAWILYFATWYRHSRAMWCHFLRVFNLAGLWEIKGPSDVLPLPLKKRPCAPSNLPPPAICFERRLKLLKWWSSLCLKCKRVH